MSKLFQLKRWLTVSEAAKHLSTIFGEDVTDADVLRLALDHRLTLSVVFIDGVRASVCKPIADGDIKYKEAMFQSQTIKLPIGGQITYGPDGVALQVQSATFWLENDEPYELTMTGGERSDVERKYWQLAGSTREETTSLDEVFLSQETFGPARTYFQLKGELPDENGERRYYPIGCLPEDAFFVVTVASLLALENQVIAKSSSEVKEISSKERNTLLTIIGVLLELIQNHKPGRDSEAAVIQEMLLNYEEKTGIAKRTLEGKFAEAKRILRNP